MKKTLLRSFSVIMALIFIFSSFSFAVSADNGGNSVVICGVTFNESGYWRINRNLEFVEGSERFYDVAYDVVTNTVTLKDAELFTVYGVYGEYNNLTHASAIESSSDLNVKLIGENKIDFSSLVTKRVPPKIFSILHLYFFIPALSSILLQFG